MAYAESESMALKRLKVALKRKDWQMFEYGLSRTIDLLNSGAKISEIQEWYKVLDAAKSDNVPEEQLQKLSSIIENILSPATAAPVQADNVSTTTETIKYTPPKRTAPIGVVRTPDIPFVIYLNNHITPEQADYALTLRHNLNKMRLDPKAEIDPGFLSKTSKLIDSLSPFDQELNGLEELLKTYPKPGIIITTGYDSEIIKLLVENDIDYSIDGVKKANSDKFWKIYPLSGINSIFWCPSCGNRSFYPECSQTVVAICKTCSEPAYPDLFLTNAENPQVNPQLWYLAYQALVNSANWLLISPPDSADRNPLSQLMLEASNYSIIENAYIVSSQSEIGTWWRNKLEETNSNANVAPVCFNVEILYNNYIKIPEKTSTESDI